MITKHQSPITQLTLRVYHCTYDIPLELDATCSIIAASYDFTKIEIIVSKWFYMYCCLVHKYTVCLSNSLLYYFDLDMCPYLCAIGVKELGSADCTFVSNLNSHWNSCV